VEPFLCECQRKQRQIRVIVSVNDIKQIVEGSTAFVELFTAKVLMSMQPSLLAMVFLNACMKGM
jgi:hypothetical protein